MEILLSVIKYLLQILSERDEKIKYLEEEHVKLITKKGFFENGK